MAKELVISTGRHETRVAIMEEDQLVEIYFQRANEYSLAGSIHKGRVTRVLPGMQSAFVDLGLERDTFLYVSDFFEENEEFEKMPEGRERTERTERPDRDQNRGRGRDGRDGGRGRGRDRREPLVVQAAAAPAQEAPIAAVATDAPRVVVERPASGDGEDQRRGNRRRRRGRSAQGGNFPESKFADTTEEEEAVTEELEAVIEAQENVDAPSMPILLPGETLSKYRGRPSEAAASFEDEVEIEAEEVDEPELVFEAAPEAHEAQEAQVTPLKAITPESIAEQREAEVLEEVKEHLAEMAKENEEQRDFEEAERLVYEDKENAEAEAAMAASAQLNIQDSDDDTEDDIQVETSLDTAGADIDDAQERAEGESPDADGVLPSLGYSAHLRQTDQRFLQQRAPQEGSEGQDRGGRRRRRGGRGRDRERAPEAAAAVTESPVVIEGEESAVSSVEAPAETSPRREDGRRDGRNRRDRGDRSEPRLERTTTERTDRPERSGDRNDRPDRERRPQPSITELLKEGQEILVQIAKEPLGQKGARITSHIALPGRYCVYMPTVDHTGVSRKIASDEERLRLKRILQSRKEGIPGGFIIRTAGEGRTEEEILADIDFLSNLWVDIRKKAESKPAPALIYHDLEIVERVLRDQLGPDFKSIWVDNEEIYESILRFLERFQPMMVSRVKMYTRQASIFDNFGITQELEKALRPKVWLKSGGYIVINQTEALVAIDINTGKFVGKSNRLEDTIVKTNIEAIREIVRQVRLRDLGGIIVIDFIDMDERKNRMRVMQALEEAMRADRAPYKILQFNDFGLVAITRKRVKQSLERTLCAPCPYCEGSAYVKSVQTVVGEILNEAKKLARALEDSKDVLLRVNPEVAKVFKSSDNQYLEELEEIVGRPVMVVSDGLIHQEKFDLA
ncbi:MAG: Rne/Rng family ribonuclease [Acidobacteria bacterium]|nr:Rne/Rng family ribonuclease [Acidobacteriota bacterium]